MVRVGDVHSFHAPEQPFRRVAPDHDLVGIDSCIGCHTGKIRYGTHWIVQRAGIAPALVNIKGSGANQGHRINWFVLIDGCFNFNLSRSGHRLLKFNSHDCLPAGGDHDFGNDCGFVTNIADPDRVPANFHFFTEECPIRICGCPQQRIRIHDDHIGSRQWCFCLSIHYLAANNLGRSLGGNGVH